MFGTYCPSQQMEHDPATMHSMSFHDLLSNLRPIQAAVLIACRPQPWRVMRSRKLAISKFPVNVSPGRRRGEKTDHSSAWSVKQFISLGFSVQTTFQVLPVHMAHVRCIAGKILGKFWEARWTWLLVGKDKALRELAVPVLWKCAGSFVYCRLLKERMIRF